MLSRPPHRQPGADGDREPEWSALMAAAQAGDRAAYRALLVAITPYVRALALRLLGNRHDAEDAVQDVLMTVHCIRHTYDPARPFRPWLSGVARNRITDRWRGRSRQAAREQSLPPEEVTLAADAANTGWHGVADGTLPGQEADHDAGRRADALHAALAALPPGERRAIVMLKLREMSLKEAAEATGASVGSLKASTHRAMIRLRALLRRPGDPG